MKKRRYNRSTYRIDKMTAMKGLPLVSCLDNSPLPVKTKSRFVTSPLNWVVATLLCILFILIILKY